MPKTTFYLLKGDYNHRLFCVLAWQGLACKFFGFAWPVTESPRVHVGIWYILRAQRGSHIPTLRPKYIPYTYMDPLGMLVVVVCVLVWHGMVCCHSTMLGLHG